MDVVAVVVADVDVVELKMMTMIVVAERRVGVKIGAVVDGGGRWRTDSAE